MRTGTKAFRPEIGRFRPPDTRRVPTPPTVDDNLERIKAVETFYDTETTNEIRRAILKKYYITHVLLNFQITGRDLEPLLKEMDFPVTARSTDFCLFSVSPPTEVDSTPGKGN